MKKVAVFGSTGSIGVNSLNVIREFKEHFSVSVLVVNSNIQELSKQIDEFFPDSVVVKNEVKSAELKKKYPKLNILSGDKGIIEAASQFDFDIMISALVGFAGLTPTIEAIKRGKRIGLANKETMVVAGEIINSLCKEYGSEIIPVDSEHSAIFQCLMGEEKNGIANLILTASGGPFFNKSYEELKKVTIKEALEHPNWKMGNKITIDSATMMNKGLEVIEAHWLFNMPIEKISIVVHPQSVIHSMVEFIDGSIKAQLSLPDMKIPIQFALTYPQRFKNSFTVTNLTKLGLLSFFEPDFIKFRCLKLAFETLKTYSLAPCVLNAANEIAVENFLNGKISFLQIPNYIEESLNKFNLSNKVSIESLIECDNRTRAFVEEKIKKEN